MVQRLPREPKVAGRVHAAVEAVGWRFRKRAAAVDPLMKALAGTTTLEEVCSVTSEDW